MAKNGKKKNGEDEENGSAGITQDQFIEGLNVDLAHEYSAVILYRTYASQVQGQWRMELRQFFEAEIPDELGHAQILADKIVSLGGTCLLYTSPSPRDS